MKCLKYIIPVFLILLLPVVVKAATCEPEKVTIQSIQFSKKNGEVVEKSPPSVEGRQINLDLKMINVDDFIEYKMVVKNDSGEDYELDKTSLSADSDYIVYSLESIEDSTIIKAGESKEVMLRVRYKNEVEENSFVNGVYRDNKNLVVNLASDNSSASTLKNPNTGVKEYLIITFMFIICGFLFVVFKNKRYSKLMILLIGVFLIPMSVYAVCKCELKVDSKVEIVAEKEFVWKDCSYTFNVKYINGMTFDDFYNSSYFTSSDEDFQYEFNYWRTSGMVLLFADDNTSTEVSFNSKIKSSSIGFYSSPNHCIG